jgi:YaiO family outer membrane protein
MDKPDSARIVFKQLELKDVKDADFYLAYGSMEYWEDNNTEAARIVNKGLTVDQNSLDLLILKAKVQNVNKDFNGSKGTLDRILEIDPQHTEARKLLIGIRDQVSMNEIGITYNWLYFDKQFEDNWHIAGLSYKRGTSIGSFIFRTNFANKFGRNGTQFELEAYPRLSRIFYMYLGAGYSNSDGIFPKFRSGASLYANLPASFEAELGFRQLKFSENVWMYTASVGKYYKNFWFNARTYLTPGENNISHSYTGTVRYYTKGSDDYLGFILGTGISPEENRENLFEGTPYKMKTFKTGLDYNFTIKSKNIFSITGTYYNVEYKPEIKDNQFDLSIGYRRRF